MSPSIGRIVHYRSYGNPGEGYQPEPRAAIITEVGHAVVTPGADLEQSWASLS